MSQIGSGGGWSEIGSDLILIAEDLGLLVGDDAQFQPTIPLLPPDEFAGNSDGNSACSATFDGIRLIVGNSAGASTPSATFAGIRLITGGSTGSSTPSANFGGVRIFTGGSAGSSGVSGTFNGVKLLAGGSSGGSVCSATFTGGAPPPPPPPLQPGSGGSIDFGKGQRYVPYRFTKSEDKPKPPKNERKQAKPKPKHVKREPEPDFYRPSWVPKPESAYEVPVSPLTMPVFIEPMPGVGRDVMDALMATMAALDVPESKQKSDTSERGCPQCDEDLELVLLADEITG